jgi:hypothetical protein
MKHRTFKIIFFSFFFFIIIPVAYLLHISYRDYSVYFNRRHGTLTGIAEYERNISGKHWITLSNSEGFKIECGLLVPLQSGKRYPAVVLLGGKTTGKYAVDYAMDIDNIIILALDYPYEPRESYSLLNIAQDLPDVRSALIDMLPSAMLAIDYLYKRSDVDTTKIVVLGYSFGAPFIPAIAAYDNRVSTAIMVYGGGDMTSLIRHNVARYESDWLAEIIGRLGGLLLYPLEPLRYADRISPRPLVMINGNNDEQIPRYNTEVLFDAAREPKKIIWLESGHVNTANTGLTRRIIEVLKTELKRLNIIQN